MLREISMHILDIAQNSIVADATEIKISVNEDIDHNMLSFSIEDNGKGMTSEMTESVRDPFTTSRTTRPVGLGIPFLDQTCRQCGGCLTIQSEVGVGTKLVATMEYDNIDRPPLGDMAGSIQVLFIGHNGVNIIYEHTVNDKSFSISVKEIEEVLDGVPLNEPSVAIWIKENIEESILEARS